MPTFNNRLAAITGEDVRSALRSMRQGKATGADGWRPYELAALPVPWTDMLATFLTQWEGTGQWPDALRQNIIALVPKPGAAHEKQLRPIGLLSYVYRMWMVIRKQHLSAWSKTLHSGRHQGAAELATRTRIDMELDHWRGLFTLLALLDCSKCYERVEHFVAGHRAIASGFPDTVLNLIMHMYSGTRRLRAHGSIGPPTTGTMA